MICSHCQATIADKAIVCYRCGAPTAIPAAEHRTVAPAKRQLPVSVIVLEVLAVLSVVLGIVMSTAIESRIAGVVAACVFSTISAVILISRRRRTPKP
jgi:hypothetical protein